MTRPKRIHGHRRLVGSILTPVDEDPASTSRLGHVTQTRERLLEHLRRDMREVLRLLVGDRRVEGHVQLQPFRAGDFGKRLEVDSGKRLAHEQRDLTAGEDTHAFPWIEIKHDGGRHIEPGHPVTKWVDFQVDQACAPRERFDIVDEDIVDGRPPVRRGTG